MQEYDGSTNLQEYDAAAARDLVLGEQREYVGEPLAAGGHEIGVKQLSRGAWDSGVTSHGAQTSSAGTWPGLTVHVANADVGALQQPHGETTAACFCADVGAGGSNDVEVQLCAQGEKELDVAVAIEVVHIWSRGVVAPVEVHPDAVQSHAFVILQQPAPSLAVGHAPILKFA